jgi:uncharacterized protein (TIGR02266 family)
MKPRRLLEDTAMNIKKILLVDDVNFFLEQEKGFLVRDEVRILLANNGEEALETVIKEQPDIVFMDLYMPVMDGDKCCYLIKSHENLRHIPVIMVTPGGGDEDFERCWQAGCDDIIPKPINRFLFEAMVKRYLDVPFRKAPRAPVRLHIKCKLCMNPEKFLSDYTVNLSTGGFFIVSTEIFPVDTQLNIEFILPDENKNIECSARVAWINHPESLINKNLPVGMGIQFLNLSLNDMDSIRNFIKDKTLTPEW